MLVVKEILPDGHEELSPLALLYMKSMAERHGFTVLDDIAAGTGKAVRIAINYPFLKDPVFFAILEDVPCR